MFKKLVYLICFALVLSLSGSGAWALENQIINSEFAEGLEPWGLYEYQNTTTGFTVEVVQDADLSGRNALEIDITDAPALASIGVATSGIVLEPGETYPIGFTAKAEEDRGMKVLLQGNINNSQWPTYLNKNIELTTEPQEFIFEYTHNKTDIIGDDDTEAVILHLIIKWPFEKPDGCDLNSKVWIDRVYLGGEPPPESSIALAFNPGPEDEATDVLRDGTVLTWGPGDFAASHDVYLGTSFEAVNTATTDSDEYKGNQTETAYAVDRLDFGQSYYWRIDEVNSPPDSTIFKGDVWSFTVEPVAYTIEDIIATASSSNQDQGPENTVNGSGLDDSGLLHSKDTNGMWLSVITAPQPSWIEYEFGRIHKIHDMWVWNYNDNWEKVLGVGVKDATIEYSQDGSEYTTLGTTHEFAQGPGTDGYAHNTTVDFGGVAAKHVRLTANSNWGGGLMNQYGLSEVRFSYIPVAASEPSPASGAIDVDVDVILDWRVGRGAVSHDVYVGAEPNALTLAGSVTEPRFDTASLDLALDQTYHWRIDEVNEAETHATWQSDLWSFTTVTSLLVDDFEDYNNTVLPYDTWKDGLDDDNNGSEVGHDIWTPGPHYNGLLMETGIVHGGEKSMPIRYDNSAASFSEATANVADLAVGSDWTKHGINALTLYFYGDPCNVAQQMYVKLNGTKVVYDSDVDNITRKSWQPWNIELADFTGVNLSNVTELTIGFERIGAVGGNGVVYFDDISLYPYSREFVTPTEPGTTGLVGHWQFEGNFDDSSGNGRRGTAMGNPTFAGGKIGQAISLDGIGDYVEITGYKGIVADTSGTQQPFTIANWFKTFYDGEMVTWGTNSGRQRLSWRIDVGRLRTEHGSGNLIGNTYVNDGEWHHGALVVNEGANLQVPNTLLYVDGQQDSTSSGSDITYNLKAGADACIGCRATHNDRFFMGQIDDARIYDRVLTPEEITWLSGRRLPFDKPF